MAPYKKYLIFSILAIGSIGGIYAYREFNRKPASLVDKVPQVVTTVAEIVAAYDNDEAKANAKYLGKTVLVTGPVAEINNQQDTMINVLLGNVNDLHKVSCLPDKDQFEKIKQYKPGAQISIKGICTGFLMDVELNRCIIVK